jgi:hypothetical protein
MYYAAVFAKVAERHAFFYFKEEARNSGPRSVFTIWP